LKASSWEAFLMVEGLDFGGFRCEVVPERDRVRLVPLGEVDLATAPLLEEEFGSLLAAGFADVVLDLRQTTFMDSTGLHVLLRCDESARVKGARFSVIPSTSPQLERLFQIAAVANWLPVVARSNGHSGSEADGQR
jgi:anti-sigma B factor antagonist